MTRYSPERKEAVLKKLLARNHRPIRDLTEQEGISEATLYNWRKAARSQGRLLPDMDTTPEGWTSQDKFAAVMESAANSPPVMSGAYAKPSCATRAPAPRTSTGAAPAASTRR